MGYAGDLILHRDDGEVFFFFFFFGGGGGGGGLVQNQNLSSKILRKLLGLLEG